MRRVGRYRNPQTWIDRIIETDPAFANVRLTYKPRYSGRLQAYGRANLASPGCIGSTTIGRLSLVSRRELVDTIIHEELHHRLWKRALNGSPRAQDKIGDLEREEWYVTQTALRFLILHGFRKRKRR